MDNIRCEYCGLMMTIWRMVSCVNPQGHQAKDEFGISVVCGRAIEHGGDCNLNAGHHGDHERRHR